MASLPLEPRGAQARRRHRRWAPCVLALAALSSAAGSASPRHRGDGEAGVLRHELRELEPVELVAVVDGDTLDVLRRGRRQRVRLLSVDTEERLHAGWRTIPGAPQTVFGEETALWLEELLERAAPVEGRLRLGLVLPGGGEAHDAHERLLAHLALPDGRDLNVLLVRQGFSPYFQRYGSSEVAHEVFERAQRAARRERRGIWNPRTNAPRSAGAPRAGRDYVGLTAWWQARAAAIRAWREARQREGPGTVAADRPREMERASRSALTVRVFGEVEGTRELSGGALLLFLRAAPGAPGVRVLVPTRARQASAHLDLHERAHAGRQNFLWVHGHVEERRGSWWLTVTEAGDLRLAGPEPDSAAPRARSGS